MLTLCGCSFGRRFWTTYKITGGEDSGVVYIDEGENATVHENHGKSPETHSRTSESTEAVPAESSASSETHEETGKYKGYYYGKMNSSQRSAYANIEGAAKNMSTEFVRLGSVKSYRDLVLAHTGVKNDFPEYFWLDGDYSWKEHGGAYYIKLKYNCSASEKTQMETKFNATLAEFDRHISKFSGQYNRELETFRWIADRTKYDYESANAEKNGSKPDFRAFSAYGAVVADRTVDGKKTALAVCEGYSRAFNLLLSRAGIESTLVSGTFGGERHMWNAVNVGGKWYNVDLTACDTGDELRYSLFNVTDAAIKESHKWDADFKLTEFASSTVVENFNFEVSPCVSNDENYLAKNGRMIFLGDTETIVKQITEAQNSGLNYCEFVIADNEDYIFNAENAFEKLNIAEVQKETAAKLGIRKTAVSGIEGTKGFTISW